MAKTKHPMNKAAEIFSGFAYVLIILLILIEFKISVLKSKIVGVI